MCLIAENSKIGLFFGRVRFFPSSPPVECGFSILILWLHKFWWTPKFSPYPSKMEKLKYVSADYVAWFCQCVCGVLMCLRLCEWNLRQHDAPLYSVVGTEIKFNTKQCDKFAFFLALRSLSVNRSWSLTISRLLFCIWFVRLADGIFVVKINITDVNLFRR